MRTVADPELRALCARALQLLIGNGQTTERSLDAVERLARHGRVEATIVPRWGEAMLRLQNGASVDLELVRVEPLGVDMRKVAACMAAIDNACLGILEPDSARKALEAIAATPPISATRFVIFAAAGAAALGVLFGANEAAVLLLIALVAGAGGALRRLLARQTGNPFLQPLSAALLAGIAGAGAGRLGLGPSSSLVALCPCMVLVPGPHLLNGMLDLARARLPLGAMRIVFACLVIVMICTGLLLGLRLGGVGLPPTEPTVPVSLVYDVLAAGVAVAAYGTFFAMPWRMLPISVVIGMLAHALRWALIALAGAGLVAADFGACLTVGIAMTPIANRLHLPFAGCAFASVVSLMPGVFLFRMAGGLVTLVTQSASASPATLPGTVADGTTALLVMLAMGFGLIVPKLALERRRRRPLLPKR